MKYDDCIDCKKIFDCDKKGITESCINYDPRNKCKFSDRYNEPCDHHCQYYGTCTRKG